MATSKKKPKSLWSMVSTDPKGAFENYFKAGASWDAVERQETNTEEDKTSHSCLRIWLFSDQVRSKICRKNRGRACLMIQGLKEEGNWRYHPDMPKRTKAEKKAAMQYRALKKSSSQRVTSNSALKQISRSQWEGSPKKRARALEDKNPEPAQKEPVKAIEDKNTEKKKDGTSAQAKKDEIKRKQQQEETRLKKKTDPQERSKVFLAAAGKLIGELKMMETETKTKKLTRLMPDRFLKEYQGCVQAQIKMITDTRGLIEGASCKDPKAFSKKVSNEKLEEAENEMATAKKTLRAWKNSLHIFCNTG